MVIKQLILGNKNRPNFKLGRYRFIVALFFLFGIRTTNAQGLKALERRISFGSTQPTAQTKLLRTAIVASNSGQSSLIILCDSSILGTFGDISIPNSNFVTSLVPADNIQSWMQQSIMSKWNGLHPNEPLKAVCALRSFGIGQDSSGKNAFLHLTANIYVAKSLDKYSLTQGVDTIFSSVVQDTSYRDLFDASISYLCRQLEHNGELPTTELKTAEEIKSTVVHRKEIAIMRDSVYRNGVYASYEEFKNNKPSIEFAGVSIDSVTHAISIYGYKNNKPSDVLNAWGFCRNGEMYILQRGRLLPIEIAGNEIARRLRA